MPVKSPRQQKISREALSERLSSALGERDEGLLTQTEYEEKLSEIELSLGPHVVLEEAETRGGGVRFVVRSSLTGDVVDRFEYWRAWSPER